MARTAAQVERDREEARWVDAVERLRVVRGPLWMPERKVANVRQAQAVARGLVALGGLLLGMLALAGVAVLWGGE